MSPHPGVIAVRQLLAEWTAARLVLAELSAAEHPDIVDPFGRVWTWRGSETYSHDGTLAYPAAWISSLSLPPASLAGNWNYWRLCSVCTREWPAVAQSQHIRNAIDQATYERVGWDRLQKIRGAS